MRLFDRLLLSDLVVPFLIGVFTFAVILLGDIARQIGSTLLNARTPPVLVAQYLWLRSPGAFVWAMPVGTLVAVSLAMARATREGEVTAIRAAGVSLLRLCLPFVLAGALATVGAFALNEWVVPDANDAAGRVMEQIRMTQPVLREEHNQFFRDREGRVFYVQHMNADTNFLENVVIWSFDQDGRLREITQARYADLQGSVWWLHEGHSQGFNEWDRPGPPKLFDTRRIELWAALQNYYAEKRSAFEMSARELRDQVAVLESAGKSARSLEVELQFKYSIPAACFVFALIGAPLAFRYARWGAFGGLLVAILIVFLYNGVRSWTLAFGLAGTLHPVMAGWLQNVLFAAVGLVMLWRAER
ncbi:MAG: YjgP/YjgQ family permease [Armatimonadetes bacterium]|nr:YjgP/YjgQ family permease [Armatimonadota bacterium]